MRSARRLAGRPTRFLVALGFPSVDLNMSTTQVSNRRRTAVPHYRGTDLRLHRNPDAPDPTDLAAIRRWVGFASRPTAVDLFSGAGGLSLGLQEAGFSVLLGADNDERAVQTHTANIGGLGYVGDLSDPTELIDHLQGWGIETVDLVAGGVPCQPFSRAGRSMIRNLVATGVRSADDPRAELWQGFMAVVAQLQPRAVLVENVPDLPSWDDGSVLMGFYESLGELGYRVDARVLDAFQFGVPQHRARLILVALRDESEFEWPKADSQITTLRDAIGDLPPVPPAQRAERVRYFGPRTEYQRRMRKGVLPEDDGFVCDHITRDVRQDDAEAFALLEEGQTYVDLPEHLRRYRSDIFTDKYKRLSWNEVSRSITAHIAKDGYWYIHPQQHRTLSIREAARVQTFPDWFRFAGQPSVRLKQIGNAVPPLLAAAVGNQLRLALENPRKRGLSEFDFRGDLLKWHKENRRPYPWRRGRLDPWLVLAGEVCLARTRSDLVPWTFKMLRRIAPTPLVLLSQRDPVASLDALGLGARAELLVEVATALKERHGGSVPESELDLRALPGIGDNVAQAVICFGFGRRAVLLDATTARLIRRFCGRGDSRRWQIRLDLYQLAGAPGPDAEFNNALLDHGAIVCRVSDPQCGSCPVRAGCVEDGARVPTPQLVLAKESVDAA
jgi:DNA (cytosine-5)-methyltransferase 1